MSDQEPITSSDSEQNEELTEDDKIRLDGIKLVGIALAHHVNNNTAPAVGVLDLLLSRGLIPDNLKDLVEEASKGLGAVTKDISNLGRVKRIVTQPSPVRPMLDLDASSAPSPTPRK